MLLGFCLEQFPLHIPAQFFTSRLTSLTPPKGDPPMSANPQIVNCFIYDVIAKRDLTPLSGALVWKPHQSIRAEVSNADEVTFNLDNGKFVHREGAKPWIMNGDANAVSIRVGKHTLAIVAKSKSGSATKSFSFEIVNEPPVPVHPPVDPAPVPAPIPQNLSGDTGLEYPVPFPYSPIAQTSDGWTNFTPSSDSKRIYVSVRGSDTNPGTIDQPVKTPAKAMSMVRDGFPDWILFERGGDFVAIDVWTKSGRSLREPMVVTSYGQMGSPRPKVGWLIGPLNHTINSVAFVSLDFDVKHRNSTLPGFDKSKVDAKRGVDWMSKGNCIHFEDCRMAWGLDNLCIHSPTSILLRRCVIERAWTNGGDKSQGIYVMNSTDGVVPGAPFTIEECIFDHNGWHDTFTSPTSGVFTFSHNLYLAEHAGPALVRRCIISRAASIGLQLRPGGVFEDNLLIDNRGAGFIAPMLANPDLPSILRRNVCADQNSGIGLGFEIIRTKNAIVEDNLVINKKGGAGHSPAMNVNITTTKPFIAGDPSKPQQRNATLSLKNNIFWKSGVANFYLFPDTTIDASGNIFSDGASFPGGMQPDGLKENTGWSRTASFPDPARDIAAYHTSIGAEATVAAFLREAVTQERANWRAQYTPLAVNAWLRGGFGR